jgi:hypothetical protein
MPKEKQINIACENRPGTLANLARALGDAKVNILAMNCSTAGMEGTVRAIVDNADKAKKALAAAGWTYTEAEVLAVELPNVPGALRRYADKLAAQGINIAAAYATTAKGSRKARIVFEVSDLEKAARIR